MSKKIGSENRESAGVESGKTYIKRHYNLKIYLSD